MRRVAQLRWVLIVVFCIGGGCEGERAPHKRSSHRATTPDAGRPVDSGTESGDAADATSPATTPPRLPEFPSEPPVIAEEDAVVYPGRVVDASGAGIVDVRVRLVGFPPFVDGPGRPFVWGAALTGRTGRFRLSAPERRPSLGDELLVVETADASRTIQLGRSLDLGEIRLPSVATVRVEVHCAQVHSEESPDLPTVVAIWPRRPGGASLDVRDEEVWTYRVLQAEGADRPEPIFPGRDLDTGGPIPPGAERFTTDITLPRGQRSRVVVDGPCGRAVREVDVQETGPVAPIVFRLPDPDAATLEIHLTGARSTPARPTPYFLDVWTDEYSERVSLTPHGSGVVRGLLPGRVRIGARESRRCQRTVEVPASTTTRVEVSVDSCLVFTLPPHL